MAPAALVVSSSKQLPRTVWVLGFVSLLMDISSEMIHACCRSISVGLGASRSTVGVIEGVAEATALIVKVFSGALSDWLGNRKWLAATGYGLAAFPSPSSRWRASVWLVAARFIDRIGKGIRGAPRDALIADLAPGGTRGAAFGLRQSLDTVGAFLGPLLAIALMLAGRTISGGVLGGGDPGVLVVCAARVRASGAGSGPPARGDECAFACARARLGPARSGGSRRRGRAHAGPLQRGLPGAARRRRPADRPRAGGPGGHERRLRARRLSRGRLADRLGRAGCSRSASRS